MVIEGLNKGQAAVSLEDLPEDLEVLIFQILESCDVLLKEEHLTSMRFPIRTLPIEAFPKVPIIGKGDDRDFLYAKEMIGKKTPPVLICGNRWIDGRHRVWALKKAKAKTINCIDLEAWIGKYPFPFIATLDLV